MRTRNWRRAEREKRTKPAYNRAVADCEEDQQTKILFPRYWVPRWQDTIRSFMANEGKNRPAQYRYRDGDYYFIGRYKRFRSQIEAMRYEEVGVWWESDPPLWEQSEAYWDDHEAERSEWHSFLRCHREWGYYDFNAPLLKRVADFLCMEP